MKYNFLLFIIILNIGNLFSNNIKIEDITIKYQDNSLIVLKDLVSTLSDMDKETLNTIRINKSNDSKFIEFINDDIYFSVLSGDKFGGIFTIELKSDKITTYRGIRIGDSIDKVFDNYPLESNKIGFNNMYENSIMITMFIKDGSILDDYNSYEGRFLPDDIRKVMIYFGHESGFINRIYISEVFDI